MPEAKNGIYYSKGRLRVRVVQRSCTPPFPVPERPDGLLSLKFEGGGGGGPPLLRKNRSAGNLDVVGEDGDASES